MFYPSFNFKENERLTLRKMWRSIRENWANENSPH